MHAAACVRLVSMFRAAGRCVCFISLRVLDWLLDPAYNIHTAVYCRRGHPFSLIYIITGKNAHRWWYVYCNGSESHRPWTRLHVTACLMPSDIVSSHPILRDTSAGPMKYQGFPHAWGTKHKSDFFSLTHVPLRYICRSPPNLVAQAWSCSSLLLIRNMRYICCFPRLSALNTH